MKIHDLDGNEHDISREEAERIAGELAKLDGHETNDQFLNRALDHVFELTGERPANEDELKKLLYDKLPGPHWWMIDLCYEAVEAIVGWHKQKVG